MTQQLRLKYENARESLITALREDAETELIIKLTAEYRQCSKDYHRNLLDLNPSELNRFLLESTFEDFEK